MPDRIIIEGDLVRHVREQIVSEAPLASLAPHLVTRLETTLPVLPQHATRYISFDPEAGTGLILIESKPQKHVIVMRHVNGNHPDDEARKDRDGCSRFNVQLPYQYFAYTFRNNISVAGTMSNFTVDKSFLFWAKDPIRTPESHLWIAPVPNVDEGGSICWGSTTSDSTSLSARLDDLVNNFFATTFNEDLGHSTPFGESLTEWEAHSDAPLAYRDWDFWTNDTPLRLDELPAKIGETPPTNIAELNPAYVALPELPANFTVARAREWLHGLSDGARRRILAATSNYELTDELEEAIVTEEATA